MVRQDPLFDLEYNGLPIKVKEHHVNNQVLFIVQFSDNTPNLVLTRATGTEIGKHWTSIPECRLKEAEGIGPLIVEKISKENLWPLCTREIIPTSLGRCITTFAKSGNQHLKVIYQVLDPWPSNV